MAYMVPESIPRLGDNRGAAAVPDVAGSFTGRLRCLLRAGNSRTQARFRCDRPGFGAGCAGSQGLYAQYAPCAEQGRMGSAYGSGSTGNGKKSV